MTLILIKSEQDMVLVIHGVSNQIKKLFPSNYSLVTQIIIINLIPAIFGLIFIIIINYFLILNDDEIGYQKSKIKNDLTKITNYLSNNSIIRIQQFNEIECKTDSDEINAKCNNIILSDPQLDPTITQKYLFNNFVDSSNIIKIFDKSWIKFADTEDMFISSDVFEVGIENNMGESSNYFNFFDEYKKNYLKNFHFLKQYFYKNKISKEIKNYKSDLFIVRETIKKNNNIEYIYENESNEIVLINSSPIIKESNLYGVVVVSGLLNNQNNESGLISYNLVNLYIIIFFSIFLISILFSKSIVSPIKILSKIVRSDRDKSKKNVNKLVYPQRYDEIGILSNDIKSMSSDLRIRIDEIENFTADVSHELKNPLASLKSSSELLVSKKIDEQKKIILLNNMRNDIERMNKLITDISSYSKTQVEIDDEIFYTFDLNIFLKDLVKSYSSNSKRIIIIHEHDNIPLMIHANKDKLVQVFINIIDNSLSYAPIESNILIKQRKINKKVIIKLCDEGMGIPYKLKDKIFERFYTDRGIDQDKHSGLGLSIAKKIIESFSGSIRLIDNDSKKHLGACFEIILPLKD